MSRWMASVLCCKVIGSTTSSTVTLTGLVSPNGRRMAANGPTSPSHRRGPKRAQRCVPPSVLCSPVLRISAREPRMLFSIRRQLTPVLAVCALNATAGFSADQVTNTGPYNLTFLEGGVGMTRSLAPDNPALSANASWSIKGWLRPTLAQSGDVVIAAVGGTRSLAIHDGRLQLRAGDLEITAARPLQIGNWQAVAATQDGQSLKLYIDGQLSGARSITKQLPAVSPVLTLAPTAANPEQHFGGSLAQFQLETTALSAQSVQWLFNNRPDFPLVVFQNVGAGWPWQEHAWRGLQVPQDPWTLPKSNTPPSRPVASDE